MTRVGFVWGAWLLLGAGGACGQDGAPAGKRGTAPGGVSGVSGAGPASAGVAGEADHDLGGHGSVSVAGGGGAGGSSAGVGGVAPAGAAGAGGAAAGQAGAGGTGGTELLFSSDFERTETPLSEGGKWKQLGLDWSRVASAGGLAFGTQAGKGGFDDSYAYLAGTFGANQAASARIHLEAGVTAYAEVEILLRWRDTDHSATGYECNLAFNGQYAEIIQWPGPLGSAKEQFKFISSGNPVAGVVHDGDVFECEVVGNVITSRLNGQTLATGKDASLPSGGAPGIGFYAEGAQASAKFSFSSFEVKRPR